MRKSWKRKKATRQAKLPQTLTCFVPQIKCSNRRSKAVQNFKKRRRQSCEYFLCTLQVDVAKHDIAMGSTKIDRQHVSKVPTRDMKKKNAALSFSPAENERQTSQVHRLRVDGTIRITENRQPTPSYPQSLRLSRAILVAHRHWPNFLHFEIIFEVQHQDVQYPLVDCKCDTRRAHTIVLQYT